MSVQQIQAVMDAAVDAVVLFDLTGRVEAVNRALERMFGWPAQQLCGGNVRQLMPEPERSAHDGCIAKLLRTGGLPILARELPALRRDGSTFPAYLSLGQVTGADPSQFIGFIRDLTDRRRGEENARQLNGRLVQVARLATMGEMVAGIAHEINQPLTAIANYARASERFLESPTPDLADVREAVQAVAAEALRAGEIVRRLRRMVRGSAEARQTTTVQALVEELQSVALADARVNHTRLGFHLAPDMPQLFVDRAQVVQLLLNLIHNALESLAQDPASNREILVRGRRTETGDCELSVCDNGPGVAPEILDRMFEPFRSTKPNGTGLGLPMSQTIAQAHNGSVRHQPGLPRGAYFVLTLPPADNQS
ncbi:MAG TPA: PAS domain S-box protein [Steroidobacteraceae bacterium]|nr:PAS domain S-box protein [Steroidobacteraceae bacterium]